MNRAERRRQERQLEKNLKAIQSLTPQQAKLINISAREKAKKIANAKVNELANLFDRCTSAALVERNWSFEEIEEFQLRVTELLQEDTEKSQILEKENVNIMKIEKEVRNYIEGLLKEGLPKKKAIDDLVFKFPKLSKSMLLNAYEKVKKENEPKITREKIIESAKKYGLDKEGKNKIAKDLGSTYSTIATYVSRWKITEEEVKSEKETDEALEYIFLKEPKQEQQETVVKENPTTEHIADTGKMIEVNKSIEKEENKEEAKVEGLKILEEKVIKTLKVEGKNGIYEGKTGEGITLKRNNAAISFENKEELEEWAREFNTVFRMIE